MFCNVGAHQIIVNIFIRYVICISGWYRGFITSNKSTWGIFPACVISPRPCSVRGSGATAIAEPKDDPLVREIACVLREWARLWKKLYVVSTYLFLLLKFHTQESLLLRLHGPTFCYDLLTRRALEISSWFYRLGTYHGKNKQKCNFKGI